MKKSLILLLVLVVSGCAPPLQLSSVSPSTNLTKSTSLTSTTVSETSTPSAYAVDVYKITPGSFGVFGSLTINNYVAGVTVDKNISGYQPLYIINRIDKVSERKSIGTDAGETIADIPLRRILHDKDISSVKITNEVVSKYDNGKLIKTGNVTTSDGNILNETLKAEKYNDDGTLTISGFTPSAKRIVTISYTPDSQYNVVCVSDNVNEKGYSQAPLEVVNWVTFDQTSIVIPPDSYSPVWVNLTVPKEIIVKPIQLWQLTSTGDAQYEKYKGTPIDKQTPEQKLIIALNQGGLTTQEISNLFPNGAELIDKVSVSGYIALSNINKWEFKVEIQLSSGVQQVGVSSEIVYRVGCKVDMR